MHWIWLYFWTLAFAFLMQHVNFCLPLCMCVCVSIRVFMCVCGHISRISRGKHSPATCLAKLLFAIVFLATLPHTNLIHCSLSLLLSLSLSCALCLSCQKHTAKQVPALSPGQALPQVPLTGHKHVQININSGQEQERDGGEAGEHGLWRG